MDIIFIKSASAWTCESVIFGFSLFVSDFPKPFFCEYAPLSATKTIQHSYTTKTLELPSNTIEKAVLPFRSHVVLRLPSLLSVVEPGAAGRGPRHVMLSAECTRRPPRRTGRSGRSLSVRWSCNRLFAFESRNSMCSTRGECDSTYRERAARTPRGGSAASRP